MKNGFKLEIKNLSFTYKSFLKKFKNSFELNVGKFELRDSQSVLFIGNNGSGKTTFLKILSGIISPKSGEFLSNKKLKVYYSGLDKQLLPFLTGRENSRLRYLSQGYDNKVVNNLIEKTLIFSELKESFDDPVYSYSTGMRARLNFSINLYIDYDILIIDESLAVGDKNFKVKSMNAIKNKINHKNKSVIFVSHDKFNLVKITNKYWFENGQIIKTEKI
jgi:lipopolysaccharide transport system ATP-binding protein